MTDDRPDNRELPALNARIVSRLDNIEAELAKHSSPPATSRVYIETQLAQIRQLITRGFTDVI